MTEAQEKVVLETLRGCNARISQLEKALVPFAVFGAVLDNVRFDMTVAGDDPKMSPGGTWYMTKSQVVLQTNHHQFRAAREALGVDVTNKYIMDSAAEAAATIAAAAEKKERDAECKKGN